MAALGGRWCIQSKVGIVLTCPLQLFSQLKKKLHLIYSLQALNIHIFICTHEVNSPAQPSHPYSPTTNLRMFTPLKMLQKLTPRIHLIAHVHHPAKMS
jgi:hypothetical protein